MRSSSFLMFGAVGLLLVSTSGCRIEAHSQTSFEDKSQPPKVSTKDWAGESISIQNDGVNPLGGTGGVEVKVDPAATKITAEATFVATADDDKRTDADATIRDALQTFVIDESNGFTIRCGHGNAHGTSNVAASGCKILRVTIPAGSATRPIDLKVGNGNGDIRVGLLEAGGTPFVRNLTVVNGGSGDVNVRVSPVKDANLVITSGNAAQVALPTTFSAAKVTFTVDEDDTAKVAARIITTGFTGMVSGSSYPAAGATADAAAVLNVTSNGLLSDDTITITSF